MKERPILFSGEMVRAILEGRKTQTRRVAKVHDAHIPGMISPNGSNCARSPEEHLSYCPYGQAGDRLWVRESFNWADRNDLLPGESFKFCPERAAYSAKNVVWKADGATEHPVWGKAYWKSSIHMPRWASRITLEITGVRVERVQEISEEDAIAEGCSVHPVTEQDLNNMLISDEAPHIKELAKAFGVGEFTAKNEFFGLWNSINKTRGFGWSANPWVWVIEFKVAAPQQEKETK